MTSLRFWFLSSFVALSTCGAQVFGTIRGTVMDPQRRPIENAGVEVSAASTAFSVRGRSDGRGEFTFTAIPAGS